MLTALARLMLIAYGQHQDETMEVKYTDVDYKVNEPVKEISLNTIDTFTTR